MQPSYADDTGEYYFCHTLVGDYSDEFIRQQHKLGADVFSLDYYKIRNFLSGPDTVGEMEKHMALPHREIMCTLSRTRNAVTYHIPFGLVLAGEPRAVFDGDSGLSPSEDGVYEGKPYDFAPMSTLGELALGYNQKYVDTVGRFEWNEVILDKGSTIVGAFYDPDITSEYQKSQMLAHSYPDEYAMFLEKCAALGLDIIEVDTIWK